MPRKMRPKASVQSSEVSVWAAMIRAMEDAGADPALVHAFQKTGIYVCSLNRQRLEKGTVKAFETAVADYREARGSAPEPTSPAPGSYAKWGRRPRLPKSGLKS